MSTNMWWQLHHEGRARLLNTPGLPIKNHLPSDPLYSTASSPALLAMNASARHRPYLLASMHHLTEESRAFQAYVQWRGVNLQPVR